MYQHFIMVGALPAHAQPYTADKVHVGESFMVIFANHNSFVQLPHVHGRCYGSLEQVHSRPQPHEGAAATGPSRQELQCGIDRRKRTSVQEAARQGVQEV